MDLLTSFTYTLTQDLVKNLLSKIEHIYIYINSGKHPIVCPVAMFYIGCTCDLKPYSEASYYSLPCHQKFLLGSLIS